MKSIGTSWVTLANEWYNTINWRVNNIYKAWEYANTAVNTVNTQGDIGLLSLPLQLSDLENYNEKRRRLVSFCNGIHYEVYELVDNPFCLSMSQVANRAYALNPSDIKVNTGMFLWWPTTTSLKDLISSTITDGSLKKDFQKKCESLDKDKPSTSLKEAIKESVFWNGEFYKTSECRRIADEIFTEDVRNRWPNMSEAEREQLVTEYAIRAGAVMKERSGWDCFWGINESLVHTVRFDANGYGVSYGDGTIAVNPLFINEPSGNYSIDKLIDTLMHEVRHEYQADVRRAPDRYGIPTQLLNEWNAPYIDPNDPQNTYFQYYNQETERDARAIAAVSHP